MEEATKSVAVVQLNGSQHLVFEGDRITINRLPGEAGDTITTESLLNKLPVTLTLKEHKRGEKINGVKFKNKVRYLKRYGHRQELTVLEVVSIGAQAKKAADKPLAAKGDTAKKSAEVAAKTPKAATKTPKPVKAKNSKK